MKDDIETLCEEIEQLLLENTRLKAEVERLLQAIGLATTVVPNMEIDVTDPIGMMQRVVAEVERLRAQIALMVLEGKP